MASMAKNPLLCQQYFCMTAVQRLCEATLPPYFTFISNPEPSDSYEVISSAPVRKLYHPADPSDALIDGKQLDFSPSEPGLVK